MKKIYVICLILITTAFACIFILSACSDNSSSSNSEEKDDEQINASELADEEINASITQLIFDYMDFYCKDDIISKRDFVLCALSLRNVISDSYGDGNQSFVSVQTDDLAENQAQMISAAIAEGILAGNPNFSTLERPITREESFTILTRVLNLELTHNYENLLSQFRDYERVSSWARQSTANLVDKGIVVGDQLSLRPKDPLSHSEAISLLTKGFSFYKGTHAEITEKVIERPPEDSNVRNKINLLLAILPPASVFGTAIAVIRWLRKKRNIFFAGYDSSGKTTIMKAMKNQNRPIYTGRKTQPTRKVDIRHWHFSCSDGDVPVTVNDAPGKDYIAAQNFMSSSRIRGKKIFILVLAHTRSATVHSVDTDYLKTQQERIEEVWIPLLKKHHKKIYQLIIILNKKDLLPPGFEKSEHALQERVFPKHIEYICQGLPEPCKDKTSVFEDSAVKPENIESITSTIVK